MLKLIFIGWNSKRNKPIKAETKFLQIPITGAVGIYCYYKSPSKTNIHIQSSLGHHWESMVFVMEASMVNELSLNVSASDCDMLIGD